METGSSEYKGKYGGDTFKISDFASVVGFNPEQSLQPFEFFGVEKTDNAGNIIELFNQPNQWVLPVVYDTRCRDSSLSNLAYVNPLGTIHKIYKSDSKLMDSFESLPPVIKNYARVGELLIPAYILYRDGDTNVFINGFIKSNNQKEKYIFNGTIKNIDEMKDIIKEKITDKKHTSTKCPKSGPKSAPRSRPSTTGTTRRLRGPVEYPEGLLQPPRRIKRTTPSDPLSNWPGLVGSYQPRSATYSDTRPGSIGHWRNDPSSLDARRKATTARQSDDRNAFFLDKRRNRPSSFGKSFLRHLMSEIKYLRS